EPEYQLAREPQELDKILQHIREKGYGENNQSWQQENKTVAIAVPIHDEDRLLGCLNLVYIAKAMSLIKPQKTIWLIYKMLLTKLNQVFQKIRIRFGYPVQ
ncbi:IclR family transcriptional regulator C-terminal domain-containing protein, partial [Vibrio sp. M60_M31a]